MKYDIFLSHSSTDKDEIHRLAADLKSNGVTVWLDEWEIGLGDNIVQKVQSGLEDSTYIGIWLTHSSVQSGWVRREWQALFHEEIASDNIAVIPLMVENCNVPLFLKGKRYSDFRTDYQHGLAELLQFLRRAKLSSKDPVSEYEELSVSDEQFERKDVVEFRGSWILKGDAPPVSVDALYRRSNFRQFVDDNKICFYDIRVAKDKCCWYSSANEVDQYEFMDTSRHLSFNGIDSSLEKFYKDVKWSFSQGQSTPGKTNDPVLDVIILNNSDDSYIVSSLGVCPLALWSIPKALPQPKVIRRFASYSLRCDFYKSLVYAQLNPPVLVPSGSPFRFDLRFRGFVDELNSYRRNESIVSLVVNHGRETCLLSGNIHLGVIG